MPEEIKEEKPELTPDNGGQLKIGVDDNGLILVFDKPVMRVGLNEDVCKAMLVMIAHFLKGDVPNEVKQ